VNQHASLDREATSGSRPVVWPKVRRREVRRPADGRSPKPSNRHCSPLSAEQFGLNTQQHVTRSRSRDRGDPRRACDVDGRQKLLLRRRQSDGGIVGFAAATRQRPSLSRSTTPRLASRPSRMEIALFSHWVAFAHWTTPASG
jgi:hypothetical protein